jgi:hypothetical protein
LNRNEWGICLAIGSTSLVVALIVKLTPELWVERFKVMNIFDEDKAIDSKLLNKWNGAESSDKFEKTSSGEVMDQDGESDKFETAP